MEQPPPRSTTMAIDKGKRTKGRQRRQNHRLENKETRQVTFSKRKAGLWKKASELALLSHAKVAIVVFSESGKAFAFGSPSADAVLRCGDDPAPAAADEVDWEALEALRLEIEQTRAEVTAEAARMSAIGKKVVEVAGKQNWWDADVNALGEEELPVFNKALERFRDNVARRLEEMLISE